MISAGAAAAKPGVAPTGRSRQATVKRLEKGDPRVPLHFLARTLHVFGEIDKLAQLMDTGVDPTGLVLMDEQMPKRIRQRKTPGGAL